MFEGLEGFGPWLFSFCKTKKTNENSYFAKQREREREREVLVEVEPSWG